MALILHPPPSSSSSSSLITNKSHLLLTPPLHPPKYTKISIIFQQEDSSTEEATSVSGFSTKKPAGLGFGSSDSAPSTAPANKKQSKKKRERASIIRHEPVEKPSFTTPRDVAQAEELQKNESAFLLAWLGLGAIILLEGIALASSGFLLDAWDDFFVKYLYPSFTPTVFLFVAGTVAYGVLKYLQNENSQSNN